MYIQLYYNKQNKKNICIHAVKQVAALSDFLSRVSVGVEEALDKRDSGYFSRGALCLLIHMRICI